MVPCGYPCIAIFLVVSAVFICLTLAGLSSLLPSMASIAFTPVISSRLVASLVATVPTMSRVMASLPSSFYQPLSSVFPLSKAVPDVSIPGCLRRSGIWNL